MRSGLPLALLLLITLEPMADDVSNLTEHQLADLVLRYPLPEGVPDAVMTREELAQAFATSLPTVSDWINKGMPVQQQGGPGKAYELRLSHCWAWRQAVKAREDLRSESVKRAQAAMRLALVGGESGDSLEALDPRTRKEIIQVQMMHEAFDKERNRLLAREDVETTLDELLALVRDTLDSAPDRIERKTGIPPKVVDVMVEICDGLVNELRHRIEQYFEARPVNTKTIRKTLFDA